MIGSIDAETSQIIQQMIKDRRLYDEVRDMHKDITHKEKLIALKTKSPIQITPQFKQTNNGSRKPINTSM